jgi:hypothetical protein
LVRLADADAPRTECTCAVILAGQSLIIEGLRYFTGRFC